MTRAAHHVRSSSLLDGVSEDLSDPGWDGRSGPIGCVDEAPSRDIPFRTVRVHRAVSPVPRGIGSGVPTAGVWLSRMSSRRGYPGDASSPSRPLSGTITTGQGAWCRQYMPTEPRSRDRTVPSPREPRTSMSADFAALQTPVGASAHASPMPPAARSRVSNLAHGAPGPRPNVVTAMRLVQGGARCCVTRGDYAVRRSSAPPRRSYFDRSENLAARCAPDGVIETRSRAERRHRNPG